jgi:hypothetical protein
VFQQDGSATIPLPQPSARRIHRIAVALGGQRKVPLTYGDFGKGFVHVMDEEGFDAVLCELDTISDFVEYLMAKELLAQTTRRISLDGGGEEDMMAFYLSKGRSFPQGHDIIDLGPDLWATFSKLPEYLRKKEADKPSYFWDKIIEEFCTCHQESSLLGNAGLPELGQGLRVMAKESRFARRCLTKSLLGFLKASHEGTVRSRCTQAPNGTPYVFLACPLGTPRETRRQELHQRCLVVRGKHPEQHTVLGLATEKPGSGGHSWDLVHVHIPEWTEEAAACAKKIQDGLGYFVSPQVQKSGEDEYPKA